MARDQARFDMDLDEIVAHTAGVWDDLDESRLLITGGSGFFGRWLLESAAAAHRKLGNRCRITVLARRPERLLSAAPHLRLPFIEYRAQDIRTLSGDFGRFDYILHAATSSTVPSAALETIETTIEGTRRVLDLAESSNARGVLITSSGAVYDRQAPLHVEEDYLGAPDVSMPDAAYGEGKRLAELLCSIYARQRGVPTKIARCFAFAGPFLPLDAHFAFGNFIRDALAGGPIVIRGDGSPLRSYMYGTDLCIWLLTLLVRGEAGRAYNVGADEEIAIGDLARAIAGRFDPAPAVDIAQPPDQSRPRHIYVPSIDRARDELGLRPTVSLRDAIDRTLAWHKAESV